MKINVFRHAYKILTYKNNNNCETSYKIQIVVNTKKIVTGHSCEVHREDWSHSAVYILCFSLITKNEY